MREETALVIISAYLNDVLADWEGKFKDPEVEKAFASFIIVSADKWVRELAETGHVDIEFPATVTPDGKPRAFFLVFGDDHEDEDDAEDGDEAPAPQSQYHHPQDNYEVIDVARGGWRSNIDVILDVAAMYGVAAPTADMVNRAKADLEETGTFVIPGIGFRFRIDTP